MPLSVIPSWTPKLGRPSPLCDANTTNVMPVTMTTSSSGWPGAARARPGDRRRFAAVFRHRSYQVIELDLDGATVKSLNFVQNVWNAQFAQRSADTPTTYAVPHLRSAGLSLSKTGQALALYQNWQNNDAFNSAIEAVAARAGHACTSKTSPRVTGSTCATPRREAGTQLCARTGAKPARDSAATGSGQPGHGRAGPARGRGLGRAGDDAEPTPSAAEPARVPARVPDALVRLEPGGSRPGKHLSDTSDDRLEDDDRRTRPRPATISAAASTTRQRREPCRLCGSAASTAFRHRVVDLAGNSVPFTPHSGAFHTGPPRRSTYRRFEPVPSPVLVPTAPRTPGESLEHLVIRSNYDIPDGSPRIVPCERHLAPPSTGEEMAETHGVLDGPDGVPHSERLLADRRP